MPFRSATTTETLAAIAAAVPCVLIGTAALRRLHPVALASYTRARTDCDYLLRPEALLPLVGVVQSMGFSVSAWGEPWQPSWRLEDVTGRFYVRAVCGQCAHSVRVWYVHARTVRTPRARTGPPCTHQSGISRDPTCAR